MNNLRAIGRGACSDVYNGTKFEGSSFFFDYKEILFNLNIFSYISSLSITSIVWSGQRLLVLELLSTSCDNLQVNELHWSDQLYPGEFDHLSMCNLFSQETCEPVPPKLMDLKSDAPTVRSNNQPNPEVLQVLDSTLYNKIILKACN